MGEVYSPRKRKRKRGVTVFFIGAVFLISAFWGIKYTYGLLKDLPDPEKITERKVIESTRIYDRTGKVLLYEIHGEEKRTKISLKDVPEHVKNAALAAEDVNFYKHPGLDWRGIIRAAAKNILGGDLYSQGGSTITQQLVKNSLLGSEKTFRRKIREQFMAVLLERRYSKDEILELYLNQIPYGSNAYGIASAAETYFSKQVRELTLNEAATLASLPKAPTYYSPYGSHREELATRRNWVLDHMTKAGFVSEEEAERAKKETPEFVLQKQNIKAPHFVMFVKEYLDEKYGEEVVEQNGLRVITSLDWKLQEAAEGFVREGAEKNEKSVEASNAALVAVDPITGEILSMVGSRDYWTDPKPKGCRAGVNCKVDPQVNVTLRARQPGSAFKPFVYATALKKGYTPETVLFDAPTEFNPLCNYDGVPGPLVKDIKDCYHPQNYDGKFRGPVSIRQALAQSLNVPSVKLLYLAGVQDSIKTARDLGISTLNNPENYGLALVLGGAEVNLLEMTSAFGIFSQEGIRHPSTAILKIEDANGKILEEKNTASTPVLDTEVSIIINDLLSDNLSRIPVFSPTSSLYFPGREVAAKTGTTQDFRDAWVIGYTPSLAVGVWVGNNDNTPMNKNALSVMVAAPIWHKFLEFAISNSPPESFNKPSPKQTESPVLKGLYRSGPIVKIDKISKKLATPYTPIDLTEETSFGDIKTILTLINKNDPQGVRQEGQEDVQTKNWQTAIDEWLKKNPLIQKEPPKETDDIHIPEKTPRLSFVSPPDGINSVEKLEISVKARYFFPLKEVSLFVDDELVESKTAPIVYEDIYFPIKKQPGPGTHKVKITAYDLVGNKTSLERDIRVSGTEQD